MADRKCKTRRVIAVYGATGYTGRLVAQELQRRGLDARLCGRSGGKLRALATDLGVDWEIRAAAIDDTAALRKALDGADVVISCAGPFTFYGAPVIEAAIDVGASYCDTTGEQPYMLRVFDHLDAPARERGVAVVPAVGFDIVPGDLIAAIAARGREPLSELVLAYAISEFKLTRGTMRSALEMLRGEDLEYTDGEWRAAGRGVVRETLTFPEPLGEQRVTKFPGGELVTIPRHVRTRNVRERMALGSYAPHPAVAGAVPYAMPVIGAVMGTPLRAAVDAIIDRLPEGPSEEDRKAGRWTILAEAHGEDGKVGRASVTGTDLYGITAVIAVEFARRLGEFDGAGALAPAQVVDPHDFLDFLGDHGVSYEGGAKRAARRSASRA